MNCFVSFYFVSFRSWRPYLSMRDVWREYSPSNGRKSVRGDGRGSVVGDRANGLDLFVARFSTARFSLRRPTVRSTSIDFRITPFFDESNRVA